MSIKIKLAEKAVDVEKALNNYLVVREPKKLYENFVRCYFITIELDQAYHLLIA